MATPRARLASVHHPPVECPETQDEEYHDRDAQPQQHPADIERGQADHGGNHRAAQTFICVGERIEERDDLEPLDPAERSPGIVSAAREDERREDQREHQADLLRLHQRADGQPQAGSCQGGQHHQGNERAYFVGAYLVAAAENPVGQWEDDSPGDEPAQRREDDLLHSDQADRQGREQAIIDLARVAQVENQGQRHPLQRRHDDGQPDDTRQQYGGEPGPGETDAGQHLAEDEEEEQRLQQHLQEEGDKFSPRHDQVAAQDCQESGQRNAETAPRVSCLWSSGNGGH